MTAPGTPGFRSAPLLAWPSILRGESVDVLRLVQVDGGVAIVGGAGLRVDDFSAVAVEVARRRGREGLAVGGARVIVDEQVVLVDMEVEGLPRWVQAPGSRVRFAVVGLDAA